MQAIGIKSIKKLGIQKTLDFEVDHKDHNFYAEGILTSNSHANAYSRLTEMTIYLKFKYPQYFFLELLNISIGDLSKIYACQKELPLFGISLLGPDILKSEEFCSLEDGNIRIGLRGIKGIDKGVLNIKNFLEIKTTNKFEVFQAACQAKVNLTILSNMIQAGTLDCLSNNRPKLVLEWKIWKELSERETAYCLANGQNFNWDLLEMMRNYLNWSFNSGKPFLESRLNTIRKKCEKAFEIFKLNSQHPDLAAYMYEKTVLGFSYSKQIREVFKNKGELYSISELEDIDRNGKIKFVGHVKDVFVKKSKNGKPYLKLEMEDETGVYNFSLFNENYISYVAKEEIPQKGSILYIEGTKGEDIVWIQKMAIQEKKIFFSAREIKND